jgi:ribosomal protein S18 acetylase RimI-like enzyme
VEVRRAQAADAGRIAEIQVRSWQSAYHGLIAQDYLDGLDAARGRSRWAGWLEEMDWARGGILVVADDAGQLAGFASANQSRDPDADSTVGEVLAIYLAPECWGRGLGRELMTATLGYLTTAGYTQVTLWVLESNARARRFYEAAGFAADGTVKTDDSRGFPLREVRYRRPLPWSEPD